MNRLSNKDVRMSGTARPTAPVVTRFNPNRPKWQIKQVP
jgi:hypothetical protein